jgi:hypothetical protein
MRFSYAYMKITAEEYFAYEEGIINDDLDPFRDNKYTQCSCMNFCLQA